MFSGVHRILCYIRCRINCYANRLGPRFEHPPERDAGANCLVDGASAPHTLGMRSTIKTAAH